MLVLIARLLIAWGVWKIFKIILIISLAVAVEEMIADALTAIVEQFGIAEGVVVEVAGMGVPVWEILNYMGIIAGFSAMLGALSTVFFVNMAYKLLGLT